MPSGKEIRSTQRREQRVLIAVDPTTPEITVGKFKASVAKTGTGELTITLNLDNKFARDKVIVMVHGDEADATGYVENATPSGFDLKITDLAGALADKKVVCEVVGWYSVDEQ